MTPPFTNELKAELLAELLGQHNPELISEGMVAQIWEDGELTLTKGGSLFGARNLHQIRPGFPLLVREPFAELPYQMYGYQCVIVPYEFAQGWIKKVWGL